MDISMKYDLYPYDSTKKQKSWCFDVFLGSEMPKIGQNWAKLRYFVQGYPYYVSSIFGNISQTQRGVT